MFLARPILFCLLLLAGSEMAAAAPAIGIRGLTNGISLADAPTAVPLGGILTIRGEGLAAEHVAADAMPLPTELGDPTVQVLINGTAAPLFFVSPTQINAQIPWEIETGPAEVVVQHGDEESAASALQVAFTSVTLVLHEGTNFAIAEDASPPAEPADEAEEGAAPIALGGPDEPPSASGTVLEAGAAIPPGSIVRVFAAGIGPTTPALVTGSGPADDTTYEMNPPQRALLGGVPVEDLSVKPAAGLVGIYEMTFLVPTMAGPTEVLRWLSGNAGASAVMGPTDAPMARYMAVPAGTTSAERVQLSNLDPYFVSLSSALDQEQGCYPGVSLMDFRRESTTGLEGCILPSWPNAPNPGNQYRPFETAANSSVLAALVAPPADQATGLSDQLLLVDTVSGAADMVPIEGGADRLRIGQGSSSTLRLERPGGAGDVVVDLSGAAVGEAASAATALPSPLNVDGLRFPIAQNLTLPGGYRLRFLDAESADEGGPHAVLFGPDASVEAKLPFPDGWSPLEPPRRLNGNGDPVGGLSLAPVTAGFAGRTVAYVGVRKADRTRDGIAIFEVTPPPATAPEDPAAAEEEDPETATLTVSTVEFPEGAYAANCITGVRWLRVPARQSLALVGTGQELYEFAEPREDRICAGDRILLFDTQSLEVTEAAPEGEARLDAWLRGTVNNYLYFGDASREVPFRASTKIHVLDVLSGSFSEIAFPTDANENPLGIPFNNQQTQHIFSESKLVALATAGDVRINNAGFLLQPFPGDAGLLVVDLAEGTAQHLALPEGFARIEPGSFQLIQQGRRGFGMMPVIGRAFANVRRTGQPPGTGIVTWDVATGEATVIPLPEGAHATVRPLGGPGANQRPFVWDVKETSGTIAFGVYNEARDLMGVAVVGP